MSDNPAELCDAWCGDTRCSKGCRGDVMLTGEEGVEMAPPLDGAIEPQGRLQPNALPSGSSSAVSTAPPPVTVGLPQEKTHGGAPENGRADAATCLVMDSSGNAFDAFDYSAAALRERADTLDGTTNVYFTAASRSDASETTGPAVPGGGQPAPSEPDGRAGTMPDAGHEAAAGSLGVDLPAADGVACTFPRCAAGMGVDGRRSPCCDGDPPNHPGTEAALNRLLDEHQRRVHLLMDVRGCLAKRWLYSDDEVLRLIAHRVGYPLPPGGGQPAPSEPDTCMVFDEYGNAYDSFDYTADALRAKADTLDGTTNAYVSVPGGQPQQGEEAPSEAQSAKSADGAPDGDECPCGDQTLSECGLCPHCSGPGCENNFDRSLCACGAMHTHCNNCGLPFDCSLDSRAPGTGAVSGGPTTTPAAQIREIALLFPAGSPTRKQLQDSAAALVGALERAEQRAAQAEVAIAALLEDTPVTRNARGWRHRPSVVFARAVLAGSPDTASEASTNTVDAPDGAIHPDCECPDGEGCTKAPIDPVSLTPYAACVYCGAEWCEVNESLRVGRDCSCADVYGCLWATLNTSAGSPDRPPPDSQPEMAAPQERGAPDGGASVTWEDLRPGDSFTLLVFSHQEGYVRETRTVVAVEWPKLTLTDHTREYEIDAEKPDRYHRDLRRAERSVLGATKGGSGSGGVGGGPDGGEDAA